MKNIIFMWGSTQGEIEPMCDEVEKNIRNRHWLRYPHPSQMGARLGTGQKRGSDGVAKGYQMGAGVGPDKSRGHIGARGEARWRGRRVGAEWE